MENNLKIRPAVKSDAKDVYRLLRIIADIHRNGRPDMFPDLTSKYTEEEVSSRLYLPENGVFVADIGGEVKGYVFCDIIKEGKGNTLYIDDLCVDPECRCMGIGKALMDYALEYAKEKECSFIMLNVWEFNKTAIKFYENYGFETRTRHLEIKI